MYRWSEDDYRSTARVVVAVYTPVPICGHVRREADNDETVDGGLNAKNEFGHPHPLGRHVRRWRSVVHIVGLSALVDALKEARGHCP